MLVRNSAIFCCVKLSKVRHIFSLNSSKSLPFEYDTYINRHVAAHTQSELRDNESKSDTKRFGKVAFKKSIGFGESNLNFLMMSLKMRASNSFTLQIDVPDFTEFI